jgi:DNA-binding NarL/FixJ family response regulator
MNKSPDQAPSLGQKIRIMIVEDHPLLIRGLRQVIEEESDMEIVAEVSDGFDAVVEALRIEPDVILMDINLPRKNGLQATREIKTTHGADEIGVVILTAYHDEEQLYHALCAGASAYFPKDVAPNALLPAIRATAAGKCVVNNQVLNKAEAFRWLLKAVEKLAPDRDNLLDHFAPLSAREMEILTCITRGASNKEIAYMLKISQQTVKNHISNVLRKLLVEDRTQAAVLALRRGWIRLDELGSQRPSATGSLAVGAQIEE